MKSTYWLDALVLEIPIDVIPAGPPRMYVEVKHHGTVKAPDGSLRMTIGHEAVSGSELEGYVRLLKAELDKVVAEAKRREAAYHTKLRRSRE